MANFRQIHVSIWKDGWFLDLSPNEKLLFIYLFSNESTSLAGIYKIPMRVIVFETGLELEFIIDTLTKFEQAGKVVYRDGIIWVINMQKYNAASASDKVKIRIMYDIAEIPETPIKMAYLRQDISYLYHMDTHSLIKEHNIEEEEEEKGNDKVSTAAADFVHTSADFPVPRLNPIGVLAKSSGLVCFPGDQYQYITIVQSMLDDYGEEATTDAMTRACAEWRKRKNKNGHNYPVTKLAWIDWAMAELARPPEVAPTTPLDSFNEWMNK